MIATHDVDIVKSWGTRELVVADGRVQGPDVAAELPIMEAQR